MKNQMLITFPGELKVNAEFDGFTIKTDQPQSNGGAGSAPTPFKLFLASIGTCAGIYFVIFCKQRGIPYENIKLVFKTEKDAGTNIIKRYILDIQLPRYFPDKYIDALIKSANICSVKKTIEANPKFTVKAYKS